MKRARFEDVSRYAERAEECRTAAEGIINIEAKNKLLGCARAYDQMAFSAQAILDSFVIIHRRTN